MATITREKFRELGSDATLALALASGIAFITSLCYEFGYFWIIGIRWISMLGPADYLRTAVMWLPFVFVLMTVGLAVAFYLTRLQERIKKQAIESGDPDKMIKAGYKSGALVALAATLGILGLIQILWLPFAFWLVFVPLLLLFIVLFTYSGSRSGWFFTQLLEVRERSFGAYAFCLVCLLCYASLFHGIYSAYSHLSWRNVTADLITSQEKQRVSVLRLLDKGIIYWNISEKTVNFAPWDDVKKVSAEAWAPRRSVWTLLTGREVWECLMPGRC
jgi:hypothetical protein